MSDVELQLESLRAQCDQEIAADGDWADITVPARIFLEILDRLQGRARGRGRHRDDGEHPQTPLRT